MLIKSDVVVQRQQKHQETTSNEDSNLVEVTKKISGIQVGNDCKKGNANSITDSSRQNRLVSQPCTGRQVETPLDDITEIRSHLLLCGAVALRGNILEDLNVTCVINATKELPDTPLPNGLEKEILYLRVNIDDRTDGNILPWLDLVTDVIQQIKMAGGKTLIHCVAGISRSAALCLAYLVRHEGYTLHDSYVLLKSLRHNVRPNSGFFGQLVQFEKEITGKQTVSMIHSRFTNSWIPSIYEDDFVKFEDRKRHQIKALSGEKVFEN